MPNKIPSQFNTSGALLSAANYLLDHLEDGDDGVFLNPVKFSFILTAAATLESMLNDAIIRWAYSTFPQDNHKRHADACLGMRLRGKLDLIGFIISKGSHITDNQCNDYQALSILIKRRNALVHSKEFFFDCMIEHNIDEEGSSALIVTPELEKKYKNSLLAITADKHKETYKALEQLYMVLNRELSLNNSEMFKTIEQGKGARG